MPDSVGNGSDAQIIYRDVARIHIECINQSFLATLGERFLTLLYESIDSDTNSVLFIERRDGRVVGFISGGQGMGSIYRQMLKRWPQLLQALMPVLLNPQKLKRIIEIIAFSRKPKRSQGNISAELFSIAVIESARQSGVATRMYEALKKHFAEKGEPAFCIVVGENLTPAHRFYQQMGAVLIEQVSIHVGERSVLYRHDLTKAK